MSYRVKLSRNLIWCLPWSLGLVWSEFEVKTLEIIFLAYKLHSGPVRRHQRRSTAVSWGRGWEKQLTKIKSRVRCVRVFKWTEGGRMARVVQRHAIELWSGLSIVLPTWLAYLNGQSGGPLGCASCPPRPEEARTKPRVHLFPIRLSINPSWMKLILLGRAKDVSGVIMSQERDG